MVMPAPSAPPRQISEQESRRVAVYRSAIASLFAFHKDANRLDELAVKGIPAGDSGAMLLPVCNLHQDDSELIATLSEWRRKCSFAFPTQFPVTDAGTAAWLRDRLLAVPDRILFLVVNRHGKPIGHLGYANCLNDAIEMEIDNVVRGVDDAAPGLMSQAMQALLDWAEEMFSPDSIFLRVFADNTHAIEFYRRLGFAAEYTIPLRRRVQGETVAFEAIEDGSGEPADRLFLRMRYTPKRKAGNTMILTAGPTISAMEAWYSLDSVRTGWNHNWNGYLRRFESQFAGYVGMKYALATSSCTGALHISLLALGIGPGDEVIVPEITWVATANAVLYTGATPVFADIEEGSWCLDPKSFRSKITSRTKAVIPVHLYGHPAKMDAIMDIAREHGLRVIEDAAPAIGAEFRGQRAGSFGDFSAFSFQGAKLLVTGEGGMLLTNDEELYKKAYTIWDQGRRPGTFWIEENGYKYKMANPLAALGLGQLQRVDAMIEAKRRIFRWYAEGLDGVPGVRLNQEMPWARSIYWMTSMLLLPGATVTRDDMRMKLRERNIDTRPVFPAISRYPVWGRGEEAQPTAVRIGDNAMNLPSGVRLNREQVRYVCQSIRDILEGK